VWFLMLVFLIICFCILKYFLNKCGFRLIKAVLLFFDKRADAFALNIIEKKFKEGRL
jgi:hypothetical protein